MKETTRMSVTTAITENPDIQGNVAQKHVDKNVIGDLNDNAFIQGIEQFNDQVGGHGSEKGSTSGLLKHKNGYILKPSPKTGHREREIKFYQEIWNSSDGIIHQLQPYIPRFYGSTLLTVTEQAAHYIVLEDITKDCIEPCVMDIKVGKQTWDPDASATKREAEDAKYTGTRPTLGFCVPGIQVHNILTGEKVNLYKEYGKTLNEKTVVEAFRIFLNAEAGLHCKLLSEFILQLDSVKNWFKLQSKYLFYSSSLLLVYDAAVLKEAIGTRGSANGGSSTCTNCSRDRIEDKRTQNPKLEIPICDARSKPNVCLNGVRTTNNRTNFRKSVVVKMIDFPHVFPANGVTDNNYLEGLENIQRLFEELAREAK